MNSVGIMTFHFCDNYGAALQCFALRKVINSFEGYQAEVINFNSNWKPGWFTEEDIQEKYIDKLEIYKKFQKKYLGVKEPVIYDKEMISKDYDYYVAGSDQIWNPSFNFFNTAYFLDFAPSEAVKIAYAASIGMPVETAKNYSDIFKNKIKNLDFIGIREKTHKDFIQGFTEKKVESVLDPTLLLNKEDYEEIVEKKKDSEKFIFLYFLKHDTTAPIVLSFVNMLSRKYNLKVIHSFVEVPTNSINKENESFYFEGPKDFLWYIKNAEIVVTNSFHGTVFSILYGKPFYTYVVKSMSSRVVDLLQCLGLENRIIKGYKKLSEVDFNIDYSEAYRKLEVERKKSIRFLKKALNYKNEG